MKKFNEANRTNRGFRKKLKKALALGLAGAVLLTSLAACGKKEATAADGRSVWQWEADARRPLSYDDYEAGIEIADNTDFPESEANYQATFTYKGEADEVILTGAFQYWTEEDAANYVAGNTEGMVVKTPYEYKEGMMQTGYNPLGDMVSIKLENVAYKTWQVTVPLASGEYYYDYVVDGVTMQDRGISKLLELRASEVEQKLGIK